MAFTSELMSQFTESAIRRSTVWSIQHDSINLAQGYSEDDAPSELKQAAIDAVSNNRNQYSDTWGTAPLREAVADKTNRFYGTSINGRDHVTITCGATESMMASLLSVVNPGEEVIIFEPAYENFRAHCLLARAKPVFVPLTEVDYEIDRSALENAFSDNTAAIIINNPNNPCGKVFSRKELRYIAELCRKHDTVAISDEVYEHMVFDGREHVCLASIDDFQDRWIVVSSCSKSYYITGWRIGYALSTPEITNAIRRCHDFLSGVAPTPLQDAAALALGFNDVYYTRLLAHFDKKRKLLVEILQDVQLSCTPPDGAYYILADMSAYDFEDSTAFCDYLLKEIGVTAVPWTSFYSHYDIGKHRVRFTFSKSEEMIREAGKRLQALK